ncbi:putative DNA polymerase III delta subunit domain protein [Mycobacterium kansasii]|uniref:Putative DNA polymerase III delta subunit domain protein n=1 Tax=Mycobacterium kansasii TaxID=1768 RepID=A0A1V3XQV1_MYCKA|nr:putative DNA polymerase III delta subunit domain protein [Mycobacterium kansasii]
MSEISPLHLVLGDEELLVERAVGEILRSARQRAGAGAGPGADDVPINRLRAGDVSTYELAELLSPRCSPTSGLSCWRPPQRRARMPSR